MTWADENQEWKRQQEQKEKTKDIRSQYRAAEGNTSEWQKVHKKYLASDIWKDIRKRKIKAVGYKCEQCGAQYISDAGLQIHHRTYDRVGGLERDSDLEVVCAGECHHSADVEREERVQSERLVNEYQRWFDNWGAQKYEDEWVIKKYDYEIEMREEFCRHAYRKWCQKSGKSYRAYLKVPDEFCEMLEAGQYDEYDESSLDDYFSWYR